MDGGAEVGPLVRVRGWSSSCPCPWEEEREENDEAKAESGMERGFVSWLSGWGVSLSLALALAWCLSLGWLFSACMFGLWNGEEGEGEGEGE